MQHVMRFLEDNMKLFVNNREKFVDRLPEGALAIIHSNDEMPRNGDQYFPYRQNSSLYYLTGIKQAKTILAICPGHVNADLREILFIEKTTEKMRLWEGERLCKEEAFDISGTKTVMWLDNFDNILMELMDKSQMVLLDINEKEDDLLWNAMPTMAQRFVYHLEKKYPRRSIKSFRETVNRQRMIKEPEEIERMKHACKITGEAFINILGIIKPGLYEYEVEAEISGEFIRRGATGHAYAPIVAGGKNACVLHYVENNQVLQDGSLVLMDFGCEYGMYSSDLSRTVPVDGVFSPRQKEVYMAVLRVYNYAKDILQPGMTIKSFHNKVVENMEGELIRLGLFTKKDVEQQDEENPLYRKYFPHGTSHFMGLDVHDVGGKQDELLPGMVISSEPGIYIIEEEIGIRLETNLVIPEKGKKALDLMADVPIAPTEIEKLMKK